MEYLQNLHKDLRRYRYFYYEKSESIIADYEYDMLEKEYDKLCDNLNIKLEQRVSNFIGFDIGIPMSLYF